MVGGSVSSIAAGMPRRPGSITRSASRTASNIQMNR
jgi:hypothetical protein